MLSVSKQVYFIYGKESQASMQVIGEDVFQPALLKAWSSIPVSFLLLISFLSPSLFKQWRSSASQKQLDLWCHSVPH